MDHTAYTKKKKNPAIQNLCTYDNDKQSQVKEKGEPWRNISISNLKKTACHTWSLTPFSGSLVMEHIAGSSRWAISFRVKKFWVAAMPRTPACLAGGKGSFSARRKAEDIIFCLTYNRITIKEWKSFIIFFNYYRTYFYYAKGR